MSDDKEDIEEKDEEPKTWGYTSYDVDSDEYNPTLTYTRYEKNGSVNRYSDNGDGGHSHEHWDSKDDYNSGSDPDWARRESGKSRNPEEPREGCYLTSACMAHYKKDFDDNCYELRVLRWFRDNFVTANDTKKYYDLAPKIVSEIDKKTDKDKIYKDIYDRIVSPCVKAIENKDYDYTYNIYKKSVVSLSARFIKEIDMEK